MGTVPLYLADRQSQTRRFREYLADFPGLPHNVRVTGLRGVGKTVEPDGGSTTFRIKIQRRLSNQRR